MKRIIEGSPQWEDICEQCGMCCLVKYMDNMGNLFLTNVRCAALDKDSRKCKCYAADMDSRDNGFDNCIDLGGMLVTRETLNNDYPVPSFCPYAQKFCEGPLVKKYKKRPNIDWQNTISETEMADGDALANHVIPGTKKFFKHLPCVNCKLHENMKILSR